MSAPKPVKIYQQLIGGVWFITSPDVKGLCCCSSDAQKAWELAEFQLSRLTGLKYQEVPKPKGEILLYEWSPE